MPACEREGRRRSLSAETQPGAPSSPLTSAFEAPTEVAGRWDRDAFRAEQIKISFILAAKFEIFQTSSCAQGNVRQVEHVIGLLVRQMHFEYKCSR